jgi:hypothetical protein
VTPGLRFSAEENTLYSAWKASVYKSAGEPDCDSSASESDAVEEVMGSSSVSGVKEVIAGSGETSDRDSRGSSSQVDSREARSSAGGSMPSLEASDGSAEDSEHDLPVSDSGEHDSEMVVGVWRFGAVESGLPCVQALLSDTGSGSEGQGTVTSGVRSASAGSQEPAMTDTDVMEPVESGEQISGATGSLSTDISRLAMERWNIFSKESGLRADWRRWFPQELGPEPEWLNEEDPGSSGTMLTANMQKGLEDLVHEMKVVPEEWWVNDAVYCVRREMEYSMKSRVGSMVPRHMRHALEQIRKYSPLHKNDTRRLVEDFVRLWRAEWARVMVQNGLNPRPFARGQPWGHWVHEAPRASAEGTRMAVSTWVPRELKGKLEDMLVDIEADPTLPRTAAAIQLLVRNMEVSTTKPLPQQAGILMWDGLHELAMECLSRKKSRFERIIGFAELWFRALQDEQTRRLALRLRTD